MFQTQLPLPQNPQHHTRSLRLVRQIAHWGDTAIGVQLFGRKVRLGFDPIIGLLLPEIGDAITTLSLAPALWVSAVQMRSFPLTIALLYNALLDTVIGALPFFIGDILDIRSKSNVANYRLIVGYLDNDTKVRRMVHSKIVFFSLAIVALLALLFFIVYFVARLTLRLWAFVFPA